MYGKQVKTNLYLDEFVYNSVFNYMLFNVVFFGQLHFIVHYYTVLHIL